MTFELLRGLVENGFTPEYRTANPSKRATRSWILDINSLILENDFPAYTEVFEDRVTPFFSKGAPSTPEAYFPGARERVALGRKSVITATGKRYTALYDANSSGAAYPPAPPYRSEVEVIKWSSLDAGKEQYAYVTPQFVQTVRLREKVTRVIEGKRITLNRVSVIFKSDVNYTVDIVVEESELAEVISSLIRTVGAVKPPRF